MVNPATVLPVAVVSVRPSSPPVIASGAELRNSEMRDVEVPSEPLNVTVPVTPLMQTTDLLVGGAPVLQFDPVDHCPPPLEPVQVMVQGSSAPAG